MSNELALYYGHRTKPSALLNSIFMTTVNTAAKTLVAVASRAKTEQSEKWKPADHMRFMLMLMTWLAVWVLRVLMDHLPFSVTNSLDGISSQLGSFDLVPSSSSSLAPLSSSLSVFSSSISPEDSLDFVLNEGSESVSAKALRRALTNVLALLNEIPASSRKYQFAVAMADKIVDENSRGGHVELFEINRAALASAFARTSGLLYRSLQTSVNATEESGSFITRAVKALPFGSYVSFFMKGVGTLFPSLSTAGCRLTKQKQLAIASERWAADDLAAEKHAQELLWITNKLRVCGAVDEALVQWSLASGLASLSLNANPRVQGFIVKITAILLGELRHANLEAPTQVKYSLLALWLPLFCYADNGLSYPVMTGYEKGETERIMDELISTLPANDQEVILTNWLQDFTVSSSDWPNLQVSYEKWCQSTRRLIM